MVSLLVTEWSTGSRTERIISFLDVYPWGAAYCHGCKLACMIRPIVNVREEGEERRSGRSHFWPNTNRTVIDGKIVVSSAHDGTSQPVCTHGWFTRCFTRMISTPKYKCPRPFRRSTSNISTNKKKKLSAPGDKQYNRWCWYKLVT